MYNVNNKGNWVCNTVLSLKLLHKLKTILQLKVYF